MECNSTTSSEIEWINRHLNHADPIDREQVDSILWFAFIWNLFEGEMCGQHACIAEFEQIVDRLNGDGKLRLGDFEPQLRHFRDRYITAGDTNDLFGGLDFRQNDRRDLVSDVLKGAETDLPKVVLALLIIVFRLRNNLFHGLKSLYTIGGQVENFRNANQLLMRLLELH